MTMIEEVVGSDIACVLGWARIVLPACASGLAPSTQGSSVRNFCDNLNDVSFETDNVLEEWSTDSLNLKIEKRAKIFQLSQIKGYAFMLLELFLFVLSP